MRKHIAFLIFATLLFLAAIARAAVPSQLTVQGVLRDQQGQLQSMPANVSVNLFNAQTGGASLLSAIIGPTTVTATNGLFTFPVTLAPGDVPAVGAALEVWLEVTVDGTVFPRQRLAAEPFALFSKQAESLSQSCVGCIASGMIGTVAASKITGDVASAAGLLGTPISTAPPSSDQVLRYQGGQWVPADVVSTVTAGSGLAGGDITNTGTISLADTIAGQRDFTDGIVLGAMPSPSPSPGALLLINQPVGFNPDMLLPNQINIGHARAANGWEAAGFCSGGTFAGSNKMCFANTGSSWYWGVQQNANVMNTVFQVGSQGQHYLLDGSGSLRGGIYPAADLSVRAEAANSKLVLGATGGVGFFADGSWTAPSPSPQMMLDPIGSLHLDHATLPGTISSSGMTVTGVGTQFDSAWVGKYLVWTTADGSRDGPSQTVIGKITAVAGPTSLTTDRVMNNPSINPGIGMPAGQKFYVTTPFTNNDVPVGQVRMGDYVVGTAAGDTAFNSLCLGGSRLGLSTCMINLAYTWAWTSGKTITATLDSVGNFNITGNAFKPGGGSWSVASDARLKDVGGKFERGLRELLALEPVRYHYKRGNPAGLPSAEEYIGFIAQSVQKVIPEAVKPRPDGYLSVNNDPILWTMVNALKEEHHHNEELQARVERLERNLAAMSIAGPARHARR
jgi:Chaperone of endosialidase